MPELVTGFLHAVLEQVNAHQYVALFIVIAIEEAGVPLPAPGDLIIAWYGWRTGGDPYEVAQVILTCALASTTGTLVPYAVARRFGMPVARRVAGWLDIEQGHIDTLVGRVERNAIRDILIARLIPGLRVAVSLVAGTARVPVRQFSPAVFVAAAIYWSGWVLLGAIVGPHVEDIVSPAYLRIIVIAIPIVVVIAFVARVVWARRRAR